MNTYIVLALVIIYYAIAPIFLSLCPRSDKTRKTAYLVYLILFIPVLICGVFGKVNIGKIVTITFEKSGGVADKVFNFSPITKDVRDIVINIFMLVPIGLATYNLSNKHRLLKAILFGLLTGAFIETMQFILPIARSPQLTDIILNTISSLIGAVYALVLSKLKRQNKEQAREEVEEQTCKLQPKPSDDDSIKEIKKTFKKEEVLIDNKKDE